MVGRGPKFLHRTIHIEAVLAVAANERHSETLWGSFRLLCGSFLSVMQVFPGLAVSSFAWDDNNRKIGMDRLFASAAPPGSDTWMPNSDTREWVGQQYQALLRKRGEFPLARTQYHLWMNRNDDEEHEGDTDTNRASQAHQVNPFSSLLALPPPGCSPSQTLEDEYDVVWAHDQLGCGIKKRNCLPIVKSVTPGVETDASIQQIATGDVMIAINGKETETIGFHAVIEIMQHAPKPLYMRFRRAGAAALPPPPLPPPYVQLPSAYTQPPPRHDHLQDSTVPSFRELREREVAAKQGRYGDYISGSSVEQSVKEAFGATSRRAMLAFQRPAPYGKCENGLDDEDALRFPRAASSSVEGRYQDRVSDPGEHSGGGEDRVPDVTDSLPRCSDVEMARVVTRTLATLPPHPAYEETFPPGRCLGPNQFDGAAQPPSVSVDGSRCTSVSSGQGRFSGPQGPLPAYGQGHPIIAVKSCLTTCPPRSRITSTPTITTNAVKKITTACGLTPCVNGTLKANGGEISPYYTVV